MPWPLSQDYNEAIQTPAISFDDADLRAGEPVVNAMGLPMPRSGNFADVYEFRSPQGQWAIKCFTREIPNLRERYRLISKYLQQVKLPFFVDFQFLDRGIRVRGQWYPILKMQWVEGQLLNEFLRNSLDRPASWEGLIPMWLRMAQRLHDVGIAHGDLQHGNIILVPGRKADSLALKLIDYDGLYVPDLKGTACGEVGHANYQHPQRIRDRAYNERVDRLPLLAIYTALHGLSVGGRTLWDRFDNGDNFLFRESDLANPIQSPVFRVLWPLRDRDSQNLVGNLILSLLGPIDAVPLLSQLHQGPATVPLPPDRVDWLRTQFGPSPIFPPSPKAGEKIPAAIATDNIPPKSSASFPSFATVSTAVIPPVTSPRKSVKSSARLVFALTGITTLALVLGLLFGVNWSETPVEKVDASPKTVVASQKKKTEAKKPNSAKESLPPNVKPSPPLVPDAKDVEHEITNSIGMKLVFIPPGKFMMGSPAHELGRQSNEDQHEVEIMKGFYLGKYEVTQQEYSVILGKNPSRFKGAKLPVETLTWSEAKEFCRALSLREGKEYRLPWEAEWEYACRAGTTSAYHFGGALSPQQANISLKIGRTMLVGSYPPNAWGLHDMHGNVWEFCEDGGGQNYQKQVPPHNPIEPTGHTDRGGGWNEDAIRCRSAIRGGGASSNYRTNALGFRVALSSHNASTLGFPVEMLPPVGALPVKTPPEVAITPKLAVVAPDIAKVAPPVLERSDCRAAAFSPDDRQLAYDKKNKLILFDLDQNQETRQLSGHRERITSLAFAPNGKIFASGSEDGTIRLWDLKTGKEMKAFENLKEVSRLGFSAKSTSLLAAAANHRVMVWELATYSKISTLTYTFGNQESVLAFSTSGQFAATADREKTLRSWKTVRLWDVRKGKELASFDGKSQRTLCAAISNDNKFVLTGGTEGSIRLWDGTKLDEIRSFDGHVTDVTAVGFNADASVILSGDRAGTIRLWNSGSGKELARFNHGTCIRTLTFSPNGRLAMSIDESDSLAVWELPKRAYLADIKESSATFAADQAFYKGTLPNGKAKALKWFVLDGKEYTKGIFAHPPTDGYSAVKYDLDGKFSKFSGTVGIRDGSKPWSLQQFVILGDGRIVWKSADLPGAQRSQTFQIEITGVKTLELRTVCKGVMHTAHSCWFDPYLE